MIFWLWAPVSQGWWTFCCTFICLRERCKIMIAVVSLAIQRGHCFDPQCSRKIKTCCYINWLYIDKLSYTLKKNNISILYHFDLHPPLKIFEYIECWLLLHWSLKTAQGHFKFVIRNKSGEEKEPVAGRL